MKQKFSQLPKNLIQPNLSQKDNLNKNNPRRQRIKAQKKLLPLNKNKSKQICNYQIKKECSAINYNSNIFNKQ